MTLQEYMNKMIIFSCQENSLNPFEVYDSNDEYNIAKLSVFRRRTCVASNKQLLEKKTANEKTLVQIKKKKMCGKAFHVNNECN